MRGEAISGEECERDRDCFVAALLAMTAGHQVGLPCLFLRTMPSCEQTNLKGESCGQGTEEIQS